MNRILTILIAALTFTACEGPKYVGATNFYTLGKGMTEQRFIDWKKQDNGIIGGAPTSVKMFDYAGDTWKVYVFDVYKMSGTYAYVDHQEYVAFKNGLLEEYGTGELPLTLRQNPNSYSYTIKNR